MSKIVFSVVLLTLSAGAQADGYAGASVGRGKLPVDCVRGAVCEQNVNFFKLYAGARLSDASTLNMLGGKVDALEVAFVRHAGKASVTKKVDQEYLFDDPDNGPTYLIRSVPFRRAVSVDALIVAPVFHISPFRDVEIFFKPGVAMVTSTVKTTLNGISQKSESQNKLTPHLSLGASYSLMPAVKVFGSSDWFRYGVEDLGGTTRAFSLGAEVAF